MEKLINDSVHGHIKLPALCVKIIDTSIFQRLRDLKQLGFGYMVYPGASHNRFEHCLGVSHLAGEIADKLNLNSKEGDCQITPQEKLCLQVAGLCHDLGHGPFSHTWEKFMEREDRHGKEDWNHEKMSIELFKLILENENVRNEFSRTLEDNHKTMIANMIKGTIPKGEKRTFLYEIIANRNTDIDVDKWDYLLRDSKYLNIGITFNPRRLMNCQRVEEIGGNYHICYRDKAREEIWQMYMMRAELHRKAYQHQVVKILEEMWCDTLRHVNNSGRTFDGKRLSEVYKKPEDFVYLTDKIFQEFSKAGNDNCEDVFNLVKRMKERKLYKVWQRKTLKDNCSQEEEERNLNMIKQKLEEANINIYVTTIEMDVNFQTLRKIYLYDKRGRIYQDDWNSVALFSSSEQDMRKHREVIFFSKTNYPISEILEENAQRLLICTKIDGILNQLQ